MNRKQMICLWIGIAVFVLMGIFPPWIVHSGIVQRIDGYHLILRPPESDEWYWYPLLNTSYLYIQWTIVAVITVGLCYTLRDKNPKGEQKE
jgi:hypothetical protein